MILHIILCLTSTYIWTNSIPEKNVLGNQAFNSRDIKS